MKFNEARQEWVRNIFNPRYSNPNEDTYWEIVCLSLAQNFEWKEKSVNLDISGERRTISMEYNEGYIEINHAWHKDGSPTKPETGISGGIGGSYFDVDLGRFAVWTSPLGKQFGPVMYADDLIGIIEIRL